MVVLGDETRCWMKLEIWPILWIHDKPRRRARFRESDEVVKCSGARKLVTCGFRKGPTAICYEIQFAYLFEV